MRPTGCCSLLVAGSVPLVLALQLAFHRHVLAPPVIARRVLRVGFSRLAEPHWYAEARLSGEQLRRYFEDGVTTVRGALRPELVAVLRQEVRRARRRLGCIPAKGQFKGMRGVLMESDALRDFYLYGPLAAIAAQIFASPGTETASEPPAVHLWSSHVHSGYNSAYHFDGSDCDGAYPPNYTAHNRPRFIIALEDKVRGTRVVNHSARIAGLDEDGVRGYWRGELYYAQLEAPPEVFMESPGPLLSLGDLMIMAPCCYHAGPGEVEDRPRLLLVVTFAPASSRVNIRQGKDFGDCHHGLRRGSPILDSPCFLRALPAEERPSRGTRLQAAVRTSHFWAVTQLIEALTPFRCLGHGSEASCYWSFRPRSADDR